MRHSIKIIALFGIMLCAAISYSKNHPDSIKINKKIICFFEVNVFPKMINPEEVQNSITYPISAIENGTEGIVLVNVLVGKDGKIKEIRDFQGNTFFEKEIREKIKNLWFTPALSATRPIEYEVTVPFSFKLKK